MGEKSAAIWKMCVSWLRKALAAVYYLVFLICSIEVGTAFEATQSVPAQVLFFFGALLIFVAWVFIILVHELGHAVTAWALGWRVPLVAVRGLTVWPGKCRARYGDRAFPGYNGMVLVIPKNGDNLRGQFVWILLGGAIANFLLAAGVAMYVNRWMTENFSLHYLNAIAVISAMTGFLNLIPYVWGAVNDGSNILWALKGSDLEPRFREALIVEEIIENKRPNAWDADLVQGLKDDFAAGRGEGSSGLLLFYRFFDERDMASARAALDWAEQKLGASDSAVLICRALVIAYEEGDGSAANALLAKIKSRAIRNTSSYRIVQAVAAWASGDVVSQEVAIRQARVALGREPFGSPSNSELLDEIKTPRKNRYFKSILATKGEVVAN